MSDTMTAKEHLKLYGIQYSNHFMHIAKDNISDIIAIENHVHNGIPNNNLLNFSQGDLSVMNMSKRYIAYHTMGMAFEILFKTAILLEGNDFTHTHKISTLYTELQSLKTEFANIIIICGWQTVDNFTAYLDDNFTNPHNKYFESYLTFDEEHEHPEQLITLFHKICECLVKHANQNNVKKPTNWTYPIRLLSR